MFRDAVRRRDPVLFAVTLTDEEPASFDRAYEAVRDRLTTRVVPVEVAVRQRGRGLTCGPGRAGSGCAADAVRMAI